MKSEGKISTFGPVGLEASLKKCTQGGPISLCCMSKTFHHTTLEKNLGLKWRRINAGNNLIDSTSTARETYH